MRPSILFVLLGLILLVADELLVADVVLPILEPPSAEEVDQFAILHGSQLGGAFGEQLMQVEALIGEVFLVGEGLALGLRVVLLALVVIPVLLVGHVILIILL